MPSPASLNSRCHTLILVSGPSGSGKTTLANELAFHLRQYDHNDHHHNHLISHANIDADNLDFIFPKPSNTPKAATDLMLANLEALWRNYWTSSQGQCEVLIVAGTSIVLHYNEIRDVILGVCDIPEAGSAEGRAVRPQPRTICVVLETASETVSMRLAAREGAGSELDDCLKSSERWRGLLGTFVEEVRAGDKGGVELVSLSMDGREESLRNNVVKLCELVSGQVGEGMG